MLAVDHGYFQGPTTGLERIDLNILPLVPYADTLMLTRGILRSIVPPYSRKSRSCCRVSRRSQHPQGALQRGDRGGHRGRHPPERLRHGRAGLHRRRIREAVHHQHDEAGRPRHALRHADPGRDGGRQGHETGRPVFPAGHAASAPSWAPITSRPITWPKVSRRSPPPARCPS